MKKIIMMLAVMLMASLASPLFATDVGPPDGNGKLNKKDGRVCEDGQGFNGATAKAVYILHKDTLMYTQSGCGKIRKNKKASVVICASFQKKAKVAMVSYVRIA